MTQSATMTISLALPQAAGAEPQAPWPPSPGISVRYTQAVTYPRIVISGAVSFDLADFSLLPTTGAQLLLITLDPLDDTGAALTAPVRFVMTGNTSGSIFLPPAGGQFAIAAPGTANGPQTLSIVATAACVIRVQAVG